jgi:two-component system, NtrC family, nitrogen regulation sensor histidine kinase GlnL
MEAVISSPVPFSSRSSSNGMGGSIVEIIPLPVLVTGAKGEILFANQAAEQFFDMGITMLMRQRISGLLPFGSPLLQLIQQTRETGSSIAERNVDLSTPRLGERIADVTLAAAPLPEGAVIILLQERSLAQRMDRQLLYRGAARSMTGMAAVMAHEIKNPLAGIRGAAQLLEESAPEADRPLAQLICNEADRIRALIDRMESFGDSMALTRDPVNIHEVLDRVRRVIETGAGGAVRIVENFDPSLPPVLGDRDNLIQAFMNIVKNAADACPAETGEIVLSTAYRPGVRLASPPRAGGKRERLSLPLEVTVRDNGPGIAEDLLPHIFDPFVTTKAKGTGLGLALVAKIVADHGGVIECESQPRRTIFRVLLPVMTRTERGDEGKAAHA